MTVTQLIDKISNHTRKSPKSLKEQSFDRFRSPSISSLGSLLIGNPCRLIHIVHQSNGPTQVYSAVTPPVQTGLALGDRASRQVLPPLNSLTQAFLKLAVSNRSTEPARINAPSSGVFLIIAHRVELGASRVLRVLPPAAPLVGGGVDARKVDAVASQAGLNPCLNDGVRDITVSR